MKMRRFLLCMVAGLLVAASAPAAPSAKTARADTVVVTTSLIETAMNALTRDDVSVLRLLPPGACPGHFDLDPRQVKHLASAVLFVRHDFQGGLDAGVAKSGLEARRIAVLTSRPAFTIPADYVAMCEELAGHLEAIWPDQKENIQKRLDLIREKAANATRTAAESLKDIKGRKVLCASYQSDFCRWAGLDVVATFQMGTDESAWQLSRAVDQARVAGAQAVVGNLQWGARHLKALAEATKLPGIMLSNFPDGGEADDYWRLLNANIQALLRGFP